MTHVLVNAKAYVALVTAAAAALLTEYGPDGRLGSTLTVIVILGGVFGTWRVPNADRPMPELEGDVDD
jgi:hypothetical protein